MGFVFQQTQPDTAVVILNQISNKLRNTSDPVPVPHIYLSFALRFLSWSLNMFLTVSVLGLLLKHWLWVHTPNLRTRHYPEGQASKQEWNAERFWQYAISFAFGLLPFLVQVAIILFFIGGFLTVASLGSRELGYDSRGFDSAKTFSLEFDSRGFDGAKTSSLTSIGLSAFMILCLLSWYGLYAFSVLSRTWKRIARRILASMFDVAPDPEIIYVNISNLLVTHTSMVPKNLSIFIQLFSLSVEHPRLRIKSLAPWTQLSWLLPSMLMEAYSKPRYNLLPALRLCLVVSGQGQSERLRVNREAKSVYSTIKTSDPLQNLYLHLLLSRLDVTNGDTDHWQEACRILKCLEYSEEHTPEIVWLIDSIQLYTLWIKEDFTARIIDFLRGVVVYLAKCPRDENNGDLRTATIVAAEWLMSFQSSDNGNLPRRYILSSRDVHSDKGNHEAFVLVEYQRPSLGERLHRTIKLYHDSHETGFSSDIVIRTLLIPIMAIEGLAVEDNGGSISGAIPRIQSGDLWCCLEGLWDLWEGGFNQSDLLRFVLTLAVPPSPVGDTQSSMVIPLLKEYLQQTNESSALITEKAFRFIDGALEHSMTTGTTRDDLGLQLQGVQSTNPWLALHIDNILRRRSTPSAADLEGVTTLDSRVKAIVTRKRFNLYLSSNVQPEPDILTLLVQSDDYAIYLEAFGQGVNLLESPPTDESGGRNPGSPRPFTFALLDQEKRPHLISRLFDPHQSTTMLQNVWIMLTEDLYPSWELLPMDWRRDIATALVEATEWMVKGQKILAEAIKKRSRIRASGKVKQLIGATALAFANRSDTEPHRKRKVPLEARDEGFEERLEACAQVHLPLFATAVEQLGASAKSRNRHIVAFLVNIPDALCNEDAIRRIQHVLGI